MSIVSGGDDGDPKYKFGRTLGQGSFAVVRIGKCLADQSTWAVKIINKSALNDRDREALASEISIVLTVSHPHIVAVKEVFETKNKVHVVMELMSGGELFDRIVAKSFYSEQEAKKTILEVVSAIDYCHDRNIAHRDLKPENLLYASTADDAVIKLADFGLARVLAPDQMFRNICGTPGYVAPEILGSEGYGIAVDMWSIGIILYILLCGYPPFYDEDNARLFRLIKAGDYEFDPQFWDPISPAAKDLVSRLLKVDTEERLTAKQMLAHPWMEPSAGNTTHIASFSQNMVAYNGKRRMKATLRGVYFAQVLRRASVAAVSQRPSDPAKTEEEEEAVKALSN